MSRAATLARSALALAWVTLAAYYVDAWIRLAVWRGDRGIPSLNRAIRAWARAMIGGARFALRLRFETIGRLPATGRYLVVSNHQSSLDIPLLMTTLSTLNLKFVAMEELAHGKPAISIAIRRGGFVTVGKRSITKDLAALRQFTTALPRFHGSPVIFPAGGLEREEGARRFYLGGIEAVRRGSRLPILPVSIDGLAAAPSLGGYVRLAGARVTVRIGDPIPSEAFEGDPRAAYEALENEIYAHVGTARPEPAPEEVSPATPGTSAGKDGA